MESDSNIDKKFTEYINKLLAGEDIGAGDEVSDDLLASIDFARIMLSNRDQPSPAFRAQLRDRLLRKLYEQEAEASRAKERRDPLEWLRNILQPHSAWRVITGTALVILIAVIGVIWYSTERVSLPSPELSAEEYKVNLPASVAPEQMTFTVKTSLSSKTSEVAIYRIAEPEVTNESVVELGRKLGISGDAKYDDAKEKIVMIDGTGSAERQLTVWTASGAVEYGYTEPSKLYPKHSPNLPAEREAKQIAYGFLEQADMLPPHYDNFAGIKDEISAIAGGSYSIVDRKTGKTVQKDPSFWLVSFPYSIDGIQATGPGAKIEVSIGNGGDVLRLVWGWRDLSPEYRGKTISEEMAYDDLIKGKGSLEIPADCAGVVIRQVKLAYWIDPQSERQDYALPVYQFEGECLDRTGGTLEEFTAWTEALNKTY